MPIHYSNVCLRFLPILDILLGRLIEINEIEFFKQLIKKYQKLYLYHENPTNFVLTFLIYYYDSVSFQNCKLFMLDLVTGYLNHSLIINLSVIIYYRIY